MTNRLGELLVRSRRISLEQLKAAQDTQKKDGVSLGYALAKMGFISDQEITEFLSQQYRVQAIDLSEYEIDPEVAAVATDPRWFRYLDRSRGSPRVELGDARERLAARAYTGRLGRPMSDSQGRDRCSTFW